MTGLHAFPQSLAQAVPPCLAMLLLCVCGMATGLAIDLRALSPEAIGSLCASSRSVGHDLWLHASLLPATNLLMLAGGLAAAGVSAPPGHAGHARTTGGAVLFYLGCDLLMLAGMTFAAWLGPWLAARAGAPWTLAAMMGAMTLGMALGAVAWIGLDAGWTAGRGGRRAA